MFNMGYMYFLIVVLNDSVVVVASRLASEKYTFLLFLMQFFQKFTSLYVVGYEVSIGTSIQMFKLYFFQVYNSRNTIVCRCFVY